MSIEPFLIGVAGGPCSGKSTVCHKIVENLQSTVGHDQASRVTIIDMENFYRPKSAEQREAAQKGNYNLDHPDAFDDELLYKTLKDLREGKTVQVNRTQFEIINGLKSLNSRFASTSRRHMNMLKTF